MMRNKSSLMTLTLIIVLCIKFGVCRQDEVIKMKVGGRRGSQNSQEIESLGRFAVLEHNKKENCVLEFVNVLRAKEQVVAGKVYHLTVEAIDAGTNKIYEAKVWVKPWINFKQLQEFKHVPSFTRFHSNTGR